MDAMASLLDAQPIAVLMDDREPRDAMQRALAEVGGLTAEIGHLAVGDYLIDDTLLVERKTYGDLVQSIIDGRLFHQAHRLSVSGHPVLMILEGNETDLWQSKMAWESIQGALLTVTLFFHIPVLHTHSPKQTAQTFLYAARQHRSAASDVLARHGRRPKRKAALQSHILQGLPGIGPKRARELLAHFHTVEAVMKASPERLSEIHGIGPKVARRIRWAVGEESGHYHPQARVSHNATRRVVGR
jgi:DNA excision repair protein ERCC-4